MRNIQIQIVATAMAKKPLAPLPSSKTEKLADHFATNPMKAAGIRINRISNPATPGKIGLIRAAIKPSTVIGATAGAAKRFAITLIGERKPDSATRTGAQKSVAAIGGASASANFLGTNLAEKETILGAANNKPPVAKTDNAKPASRDCHGSAMTTAAIAKPSAGSESAACR